MLHGYSDLATRVHAKKKKEETIASSEKQAIFPWHHVFGYVLPWINVENCLTCGRVLEN